MISALSPKARALMLEFEGMDQPARWPGEDSGITLGHGFDLGYATEAQFKEAWERYLKPSHFALLRTALGVKGTAAKRIAPKFAGITLTVKEADDVFERCTVPRWLKLTADTFPGIELLPADAQGALVSLCFNRGTALEGARRSGMRNARNAIAALSAGRSNLKTTLALLAQIIRNMQPLWPDNPGLQRRRRAESDLIASAA